MNRRAFLRTATTIALGAAVGCGRGKAVQELRVFVYAGGQDEKMRAGFVPQFEAATGATVSLHSGWWDGIPKLKTSPANDPPYDLMITDATQGYPAVKDGLFAQLDWKNIPNKTAVAAPTLDNWVARDGYGFTYPDAVMTLGYNKKAATPPPTRWADLLRDDLSGKLGLYGSFYMSLYTFACVLADVTGQPGTAHDLIEKQTDEVMRFAREHRKRVKLWWPTTTDMILAVAGGNVAAGNMHSPEYIQALREKPDLGAAVPEADRALVQVFWAIPAGTKNKALAERAIDYLFSEECQVAFARGGSACARPDAAAKMAAEDPLWKSLYPHAPEQFAALRYYPYDAYARQWDHLADTWDRTVLRGG